VPVSELRAGVPQAARSSRPALMRRRASAAALRAASLLLLHATLCPTAQTPGFPCQEYEWVNETWQPPQEPQCHNCYVCTVGQVCRQRGGCFNCPPGEYDDDRKPLSPCVACPAGKTSQEEAATACTVVVKNLWEQFMELDTVVQVVCGSGLLVFILVIVAWCCTGRQGGLPGLCKLLLRKINIVMPDPEIDDDGISRVRFTLPARHQLCLWVCEAVGALECSAEFLILCSMSHAVRSSPMQCADT
jgi:hypothetical protein